jgi:hypothetical protein
MNIGTRVLLALGLLAVGWTLGYAQRAQPEFMIAIDAPAGNTRIQCVSGCELVGARDMENPNAGRMKTYQYSCGGSSESRCAARVAGWLVK